MMRLWPELCFCYPQSKGINLMQIWIGLDWSTRSLIRRGLLLQALVWYRRRLPKSKNGSRWVRQGLSRERVDVTRKTMHTQAEQEGEFAVKMSDMRRRQRNVEKLEESKIDRCDCTTGVSETERERVLRNTRLSCKSQSTQKWFPDHGEPVAMETSSSQALL